MRDIDVVREVCHGENVTERAKGFNYGLLVRFDSREDEKIYQKHELHTKVIECWRAMTGETDIMAMDFQSS